MVQFSHAYMTTGKNHSFDYMHLCRQSDVFVFNIVSSFVIAFHPRKKSLFNFMIAVTICSDLGTQENKICHCLHFSPFYLPWSDRTGCNDSIFFSLMLSFKPAFSLSSFVLIKRLFSSSSLSAIRMVAYLRLLIFLLAILIPACTLHIS